jgi:enediyne biosynthesis protein E4
LDGKLSLSQGNWDSGGFAPAVGTNAAWRFFIDFFALMCVLLLCTVVPAQDDQSGMSSQPKTQDQGGAATGKPHPAVRDKQNRVITAGGFVDGAPVVFEDLTVKSRLDSFLHQSGTPQKKFILETLGSGVAILDYDNDGWPDIYLLNGGTFDSVKGKTPAPHAALFHNNHDGTFTDVTAKAGVANDRWGFGVAVGDFDNDGWPDLYVTNFGKNRLYHNNHNGTFTDIGERAGVALGGWSTGATFGDYDGDGLLDLFVAGYVKFDLDNPPTPGSPQMKGNYCGYRGESVMCGPRSPISIMTVGLI